MAPRVKNGTGFALRIPACSGAAPSTSDGFANSQREAPGSRGGALRQAAPGFDARRDDAAVGQDPGEAGEGLGNGAGAVRRLG